MSLEASTEKFPRLQPDTAESCPEAMTDIQNYLRLEDGDGDVDRDRALRFLRTALAYGGRYWIWEYNLSDGTHCYVTVEQTGNQITTCMDWGTDRFTPEQYLADQRDRMNRH